MPSYRTQPVYVTQGDEYPDLIFQLKTDSDNQPYSLVDKQPYAVLVRSGEADTYEALFPLTIVDEALGKVKLVWNKPGSTVDSYLDDLEPGAEYELQLFTAAINQAPRSITLSSNNYYSTEFDGDYLFTGAFQDGSPIYKHETKNYFLSRSDYDSPGYGKVWVHTSLRPATWAEVGSQVISSLDPEDLETIPVRNFYLPVADAEVDLYDVTPPLSGLLEAFGFILNPDELVSLSTTAPQWITVQIDADGTSLQTLDLTDFTPPSNDTEPLYGFWRSTPDVNGLYYEIYVGVKIPPFSYPNWRVKWFNADGRVFQTRDPDDGDGTIAGIDDLAPDDATTPIIGDEALLDMGGNPLYDVNGNQLFALISHDFTITKLANSGLGMVVSVFEDGYDPESRDTQTIITKVPILVRSANRLAV